jgi:hypothetical protein
MTVVRNRLNHPWDLTGGGAIAPGDVSPSIAIGPHEQAGIDSGALLIVDPTLVIPPENPNVQAFEATWALANKSKAVS